MANVLKALLHLLSVIQFVLLSDGEKRLLLHSGDDIAREFQMLRQEMAELKANHSKEIQDLKYNQANQITTQTKEIKALQTNQTQEIQALKATQTQEILALKTTQTQEIQMLKDNQTQELQNMKTMYQQELGTEIQLLKKDQGSTYVRWGRTTCSGNGTEKVYSGFTAGTPYDRKGAGSNLCLPQHPTWAKYKDGLQNLGSMVSGTEYEINEGTFEPFPQRMNDQDVPCVVCRSQRPTTIMIPGRKDCYSGWTTEYVGYLMSGYYTSTGNADYACVDVDPESVYHGEANQNGKLFYFNEVKCGSLPCQEYPDGRELACAVCSK